jgi:sortase A
MAAGDDTLAFDIDPTTRRSTPSGFLLDAVRRRDAGRQTMSVLTTLLFVAGASLFAWPALTDVYTNQVVQQQLAEDFQQFELSVGTFDEYQAAVSGQDGVALTKIAIPAIGIETLVVEGTTPSELRAGAGHYVETPLPGEVGNVAIAGHRTTYGRPFNRLDELDVGDTIWLATPVGDHQYRVVGDPASPDCRPTRSDDRPDAAACITNPSDWSVVTEPEDPGAAILTLTTCHPKGSAAERLIIRAELVESFPEGTYDAQRA